jgi:hypothetical protein
MKHLSSTFLLAVLFISFSCSESDEITSSSIEGNLIVYKNQTGDPNADALQAQHVDADGVLNIYGNFDANNNPQCY